MKFSLLVPLVLVSAVIGTADEADKALSVKEPGAARPVVAAKEPGVIVLPPGFPPQALATGQPWLGLKLMKPDAAVAAHIPSLPPGIGFLVKSVDEGGPAEQAGLAVPDVIWKLDDQMLVNEAQLATLLRLFKPGDEVSLSVFRGGQPLEIKLALGEVPPGSNGFNGDMAEMAIMPGEDGPMRLVNVADRTATYSNEEGRAVLKKQGAGYLLVITAVDGAAIYEGEVPEDGRISGVPKEWLRRVYALRRGLDHALENRMLQVRPPRPRVVPAAPKPE